MPRAPKVKAEEEGDVKPYDKVDSPKKKSPAKADGGGQKGEGPWTPDQAWALFNALYKKDNGVNWAAVSEQVGRAPKSCSNGYESLFKKKLEGIIKGSVRGG